MKSFFQITKIDKTNIFKYFFNYHLKYELENKSNDEIFNILKSYNIIILGHENFGKSVLNFKPLVSGGQPHFTIYLKRKTEWFQMKKYLMIQIRIKNCNKLYEKLFQKNKD